MDQLLCIQLWRVISIEPQFDLRLLSHRGREADLRSVVTSYQRARERERTADLRVEYAKRAGIEGTVSRAVRTCDVRRSKYIGLSKTHLHHLLSATSLSFLRVGEWLMGVPEPATRRSPFVRLIAQPAAA